MNWKRRVSNCWDVSLLSQGEPPDKFTWKTWLKKERRSSRHYGWPESKPVLVLLVFTSFFLLISSALTPWVVLTSSIPYYAHVGLDAYITPRTQRRECNTLGTCLELSCSGGQHSHRSSTLMLTVRRVLLFRRLPSCHFRRYFSTPILLKCKFLQTILKQDVHENQDRLEGMQLLKF